MKKTDNKWAAEMMGLEVVHHYPDGTLLTEYDDYTDFRTDANAFRALMRCPRVKYHLTRPGMTWMYTWHEVFFEQPTALRRLREEMDTTP